MTAHLEPVHGEATEEDPRLGPGTLLWRYLGDLRLFLVAAPYGMLELMHPAVGAGVTGHSDFFGDPWDRVLRSIPEIIGTVYDPIERGTGTRVRDYHRNIRGTDAHGKRYHALEPDTYYWTHATMVQATIDIADVFGDGLTTTEREQLYQETTTWFRRYGVSDRPMPTDYAAFQQYFDDVCRDVLEATQSARWLTERLRFTSDMRLPYLPQPVERVLRPVIMSEYRVLTAALLPEPAREKLGLRYSRIDQAHFRAVAALIRNAWPLIPEPLRFHPRARAGMRHARALGQD
ncbi:oxygenase MpaB family protein [Nocardia sp. NPDC057455]|uniref:oxygenase MpaB family protein n=1 Tax=Nocardia sp. NPDC057455 TaxID=3346138 RepID=UPI00366FA5A8